MDRKAIHFGKYVHGTCWQQMGHMSLELRVDTIK
jgi:hypothetical protein